MEDTLEKGQLVKLGELVLQIDSDDGKTVTLVREGYRTTALKERIKPVSIHEVSFNERLGLKGVKTVKKSNGVFLDYKVRRIVRPHVNNIIQKVFDVWGIKI